MKRILIKYLKESEDHKEILDNILSKNIPSGQSFEYAAEATNDDVIKRLRDVVSIGLSKSIDNLKKSDVYQQPNVKVSLTEIQKIVENADDLMVAQNYLTMLNENIYDPYFKAEYMDLINKLDENKRIMTLSHYYIALDNNQIMNKRVNEVKEALYNMIIDDNELNEAIFLNISENLVHNPTIYAAVKYITESRSNLSSNQEHFIVQNVTGIFEQLSQNEFILHAEGRNLIYNENENFVKDMDESQKVSKEFIILSKLIDSNLVSITETINIHANKLISINDSSKQIFVDGKEIAIQENNIPYTLVYKYNIDKLFIPTFEYIYEHTNFFVSIDSAKKIQHKENKDLNVVIFNLNENLFAFKTNKKVAAKYITENYSPNELRSEILEFINFDIKKDLAIYESLFIKENQVANRKKEILKQISELEDELEKILTAENEEDLDDPALDEIKKILQENIIELRKSYKKVNEEVDEWVEVKLKGKSDIYWVKALDFTTSSKNDTIIVKDKNGNEFDEIKRNINPIED